MADSILTRRDGNVAWVIFNRPAKRNALDADARQLLAEVCAELDADPAVRIVVLTGEGTAFCAGTDLTGSPVSPERHPSISGQRLVGPVESLSKPVLAAVNGAAAGGGFEFALAADMRVAAPAAKFLLPELRIGSLPGSGGTQRIFAALPSAIAWKTLLSGMPITADDALRYGLVSDLFAEETFRDDVAELAQRIASAAPLSLKAAKQAGRAYLEAGREAAYELERSLWATLAETADRAEGRAAFREKREPRFTGN
jgi:enoyl-CoA hydratase/carnithine racemase